MPAEIKYGVVIDNKDIHETGMIRVLTLEQDLPATYRSKSIIELKTILFNLDNAGNYTPWQKSTKFKVADPYLADAFLPKQINIIPQEGQLVKLMLFNEANNKEYVGPHITSLENQNENYVNAINSFKVTSNRNLISKGYVNKVSDYGLYGSNSQLILSDKELFLRTNAQSYDSKRKDTNMAIFQQSSFDTSLILDNKTITSIETPEILISHIVDVQVVKKYRDILNEKTIVATIKVSSVLNYHNSKGKIGVTDRTYSPTIDYNPNLELVFELTTDNANDVNSYVTDLKIALLNKKISELLNLVYVDGLLQTTVVLPTYQVVITDYRTMTQNYTEILNRSEVDVLGLIVKINTNQVTYVISDDSLQLLGIPLTTKIKNPVFYNKEATNLVLINSFISKYRNNYNVETVLFKTNPKIVETVTSEYNRIKQQDSYTLSGSKKILLVSTEITPNLISDNPANYGLTQKELNNLVDPRLLNTFSSVRGEKIIDVLNLLIDLFISHGHSTGVTIKDSLEDDTRNKLIKVKEELTKKVNPDLSGGTNLLNQYIRIN